jgi:hypothetical protein
MRVGLVARCCLVSVLTSCATAERSPLENVAEAGANQGSSATSTSPDASMPDASAGSSREPDASGNGGGPASGPTGSELDLCASPPLAWFELGLTVPFNAAARACNEELWDLACDDAGVCPVPLPTCGRLQLGLDERGCVSAFSSDRLAPEIRVQIERCIVEALAGTCVSCAAGMAIAATVSCTD